MRKACAAIVAAAWMIAPGAGAQDAAPQKPVDLAAVRQDMVGTWQDEADTRFTRELDANGRAFDRLMGEESDSMPGSWIVFLGAAAPKKFASGKLDANGVYLEIDRDEDTLLFQLVRVTRADMEMVDVRQKKLMEFSRLD